MKKKSSGEEYEYCPPYCKECTSNKFKKWSKDNIERKRKNNSNYEKTPKGIENRRNRVKSYNDRGKRKEWLENNKDKQYEYNKKHRNHDITDNEWENCKNYFNYRCAYCGLAIEEHFIVYRGNTQLGDFHREHVDDDGANDLSNCIPSCKPCNVQKHTFDFELWYLERCSGYSEERYLKIMKWLDEDYEIHKDK
jgi:hypothetical protein